MDQNQQQFQGQYEAPHFQTPVVKNAAYYRKRAWDALKKPFWIAVLAAFLASIFGVVTNVVQNINVNISLPAPSSSGEAFNAIFFDQASGTALPFEEVMENLFGSIPFLIPTLILVGFFAFAYSLAIFLVGSVVRVGYAKFNLDVIDGKAPLIKTMFSYFRIFGKSVGLNFIYSLLQTLAFLPMLIVSVLFAFFALSNLLTAFFAETGTGIFMAFMSQFVWMLVALATFALTLVLAVWISCKYSFAFTILAEYPDMKVMDALRSSATLTKGHKWRFFCLQISFIGWWLLCAAAAAFTCGLGALLIFPMYAYQNAAFAAFYDDLANRSAADEVEFPSLDPDDYQFHQENANDSANMDYYPAKEWKFRSMDQATADTAAKSESAQDNVESVNMEMAPSDESSDLSSDFAQDNKEESTPEGKDDTNDIL